MGFASQQPGVKVVAAEPFWKPKRCKNLHVAWFEDLTLVLVPRFGNFCTRFWAPLERRSVSDV